MLYCSSLFVGVFWVWCFVRSRSCLVTVIQRKLACVDIVCIASGAALCGVYYRRRKVGEIYKFCGSGGMCNTHHWLRGDGRPWPPTVEIRLNNGKRQFHLNRPTNVTDGRNLIRGDGRRPFPSTLSRPGCGAAAAKVQLRMEEAFVTAKRVRNA